MPAYTRIIENLELTSTLRLVGPEWSNTLVRNVTIHDVAGDGIYLSGVTDVRIENCTIYNVRDSGIRLGIASSTENVVIASNTIHDTWRNGIAAGQRVEAGIDHKGLQILGNTVFNTGIGGGEGLYHGLYIQTQDFLIEGNRVGNSFDGNGISVRSSGIIRNNYVSDSSKGGITYFADHMRGPSDHLLIEGNLIRNSGIRLDYAGIELVDAVDPGLAVHGFTIRNNLVEETRTSSGPDLVAATDAGARIKGRGGNDTILGGAGNDLLDGGPDDDTIEAGAGDDILVGGAGNDLLVAGTGADRLYGEDGDDLLIWAADGPNDAMAQSSFDGGLGSDTLRIVNGSLAAEFAADGTGILLGYGLAPTTFVDVSDFGVELSLGPRDPFHATLAGHAVGIERIEIVQASGLVHVSATLAETETATVPEVLLNGLPIGPGIYDAALVSAPPEVPETPTAPVDAPPAVPEAPIAPLDAGLWPA